MRQVIFFFLLALSIIGHAQNNGDKDITIGIACGFAGVTSDEVIGIRGLTNSLNFGRLKRKLFSNNRTEALLSAISLREFQAAKSVNLTTEEKNRIGEIEKWGDKYSVCHTCTEHFDGTVREIFAYQYNPVYMLISKTLFQTN